MGSLPPATHAKSRRLPAPFFLMVYFVLAVALASTLFLFRTHNLWRERSGTFVYGWDGTYYYLWLRSPILDEDLDFENDIGMTPTFPEFQRQMALPQPRTKTGKLPNKYSIGWALYSLPFYLVGHAMAGFAAGLGGAERWFFLAVPGPGLFRALRDGVADTCAGFQSPAVLVCGGSCCRRSAVWLELF